MSAYMVNRNHIRYLIEAAFTSCSWGCRTSAFCWWHGESRTMSLGDHKRAVEVAQMLWDENHKSVCDRYPDSDDLPGPIDQDFVYQRHRPSTRRIDPIAVLKACDCFQYQACEHEGWTDSEAKAFVDALRSAAWHALPGYEEAPWGAPELGTSAA